jgi:pectate lyase
MKKRNIKNRSGWIIFVLFVFCLGQVCAAPCGDVNSSGGIDIVDALLIAQYYVGLNPANFDSGAADVNASGTIDILDALLIAQYYVGLITELPGCSQTPEPTYTPNPSPVPGSIVVPDGYTEGTTGGGNASPLTVSSASEFTSAVNNDSAKVIIVNGRFNLGGSVTIGSNTTLKGANSNSGLYGGTVKIQGTNNIIQNLTFGPVDGDVVEVSGATKIFIHKCTFHDSTDELCSIVRQADYGAPGSGGQIGWSQIKFDGCTQPTFMSNSFPVFSPPYSFTMDPVDSVESIVKNGAGNR